MTRNESRKMRPVVKLWLETDRGYVFGKGAFDLLDRIERFGTISKAASSMNMSYRQAWGILKKIEARLGKPLIETNRGGAHGGGRTTLTPLGKKVLQQYIMEEKAVQATKDDRWKRKNSLKELDAENTLAAKVLSVEKGEATSLVKVIIPTQTVMTTIVTNETMKELDLKEGTSIRLVIEVTSMIIGRSG